LRPPRRQCPCPAQCPDPGGHHDRPAGWPADGGAILTETIFSWPGIGKWMIDSIFKRDYPWCRAGLLLIALIVMAVNLIVDVLYAVINPRIRVQMMTRNQTTTIPTPVLPPPVASPNSGTISR
jgi:hypothetical protein